MIRARLFLDRWSLTDDDGKPLAHVPLQLLKPDNSIISTTFTDINGEFSFRNVEPGDYSVKDAECDKMQPMRGRVMESNLSPSQEKTGGDLSSPSSQPMDSPS